MYLSPISAIAKIHNTRQNAFFIKIGFLLPMVINFTINVKILKELVSGLR